MARFGQGFIQALINPSYRQGLFTAGQQLGSAPGRYYEEQEKQRKEKGLLGGLMAIEQAAASGTLTDDMLRAGAGSLAGLGLPPDKVMGVISNARQLQSTAETKKENEKKTQKSLEMRSSLGEDFVANADERLYDEDVRRDVSRRIAAGQITDLSTALTSAQNQTEEKNKQSYYSNLGNYDKRLFALVARGEFEAADKLFAALNPPEEKVEAEKTMEKFYTGGGILTDKNRKAIFKAVSAAADNDLEATISTMNSLETQSLRARADAFKGPKQKITYIPKGNEFSLQTGAVDTKTIDAPIDPATGEIDKAWLDDFIEYSAQRIIGMGELTPADRNTVNGTGDQTTSGTSGSSGDTPRSLFTNYPSTAQN